MQKNAEAAIKKNDRRVKWALILLVAVLLGLNIYNAYATERLRQQIRQDAELREASTNKKSQAQLDHIEKFIDENAANNKSQHADIIRYFRCVVLAGLNNVALTEKKLDDCLKGELRDTVLEEQDFL